MIRKIRLILALGLFIAALLATVSQVKGNEKKACAKKNEICKRILPIADTVPPAEIMDVITAVIYATNTFNIESVSDLYTPNAVIADDDPPFSWNGPTAGVQWVNAVEKVCKDNRLTKLKGTIEPINIFQQSADNVYVVVPVNYTGNLPDKERFAVKGAFTFVLRLVNGKWMIKSQVWMRAKGINGRD